MSALAQAHPPFTSDEFYRMADRGAFSGFRVELRRGMILKMSPQHIPHARVKAALSRALEQAIAAAGLHWEVLTEATVSFGGGFEPMADITVFDPALAAGARTIPASAVKLVVEVSETTLADDLGDKREDYANAGLGEYWVADVEGKTVIRHSQPKNGGYLNEAAPVPISEPLAMLTHPAVSARV